jgi:hypothetical protein
MTLTAPQMKKLAFIKYLFQHAVSLSHQPEPLSYASLLCFHDTAELYMHLAQEISDAGKAQITKPFETYLRELDKVLMPLAHKQAMVSLHNARNNFKHQANFPHPSDIENYRLNTTNFLQDNCKPLFGLEFDALSLADMVQCERTRECLKEAENFANTGDLNNALTQIAVSFYELLEDFESNRKFRGISPHDFEMRPLKAIWADSLAKKVLNINDTEVDAIVENLDKIEDAIDRMQSALRILSLGLDYKKYCYFAVIVPRVWKSDSGEIKIPQHTWAAEPSRIPYEFCYNFVIESALKLQEPLY